MRCEGAHRCNEFRAAGEGIASNILSERLARLEASGIVSKRTDPQDSRRFIYRLTDKGMDLAPVLVDMVLWAARHETTDAPAPVVRMMRSDRDRFIADLRRCWKQQEKDEAR